MNEASLDKSSATNEAYAATAVVCNEQGLSLERMPDPLDGWLEVKIHGAQCTWNLAVNCLTNSLTRLPNISLRDPDRFLAHVGYEGSICVSDGLGLSLDPERRADIVSYTVISAFNLLEKWSQDDTGNIIEFYNELEGYWHGLPDIIRAQTTVEINQTDRLVTGYFRNEKITRWYLVERNNSSILEKRIKGLASHRAIYLHFNEPIEPPLYPHKLEIEFIETIQRKLSVKQRELWEQLLGPSKNGPKTIAVMASFPRAAGGFSLIGATFKAKSGKLDSSSPVKPLALRRLTSSYMRERGGASLDLLNKHVVIVGCGSVGSVVADLLAAVGIGHITLVDKDVYSEDNIFRHIVEPSYIDAFKVNGLAAHLKNHYPAVTVTAEKKWAEDWLSSTNLSNVDGIVFALGLPTLERAIYRKIRAIAERPLPLLFTWLEPLDIGGHSMVCWTHGQGCLDCTYRNAEGQNSLLSRTAFLEPNQMVSKNLTGCTSVFVPYGALQSRRTALMAAEHLLAAMNNAGPSYRYWIGEGKAAAAERLRTTPWYEHAKTLGFEEASKYIFGRACKNCRIKK